MEAGQRAMELIEQGCNCSQAILAAFGGPYGVDEAAARDLARAFGGGMGRHGLTCGAITGAVMVLGLAGRDQKDEGQRRRVSFGLVRELMAGFQALHGTVACKELLGVDLSTDEGARQFVERELFANLCPAFIRDAAQLLTEILPAPQGT